MIANSVKNSPITNHLTGFLPRFLAIDQQRNAAKTLTAAYIAVQPLPLTAENPATPARYSGEATVKSQGGKMSEQLDLNQLRATVLRNQQRGGNTPDAESVFITPEGEIQMGNSGAGTAGGRGERTGTKLPPTVFA
jgi:hypothetical protein